MGSHNKKVPFLLWWPTPWPTPTEGATTHSQAIPLAHKGFFKSLHSHQGGEYMSIEFVFFFLKEHVILSQHSAPRTLQQNGVVERRNRTLLDMVRSMMSFSTLPPFGDIP